MACVIQALFSLVAQSCPTLCDPMDSSPPGSSVHGISLARILEWVAISFSRGSSQSRDQTRFSCVSCIGRWILYHHNTWGAPIHSLPVYNVVSRTIDPESLYFLLPQLYLHSTTHTHTQRPLSRLLSYTI